MSDRVRASYDTVAGTYAAEIAGELPAKPVDRALYALFAELVRAEDVPPKVADVGCGPGQVGAHLATLDLDVIGIDLSPGMVEVARTRYPDLEFRVGDMIAPGGLGAPDAAWAGAVCSYSIVHFGASERVLAFTELARVIRPGGWLLLGFHTSTADHATGERSHIDDWWGHEVDLDFEFIDPAAAAAELAGAGFFVQARLDREPFAGAELPSRRSYLLAQRR
jgi:SAM-dependent methyltransferase